LVPSVLLVLAVAAIAASIWLLARRARRPRPLAAVPEPARAPAASTATAPTVEGALVSGAVFRQLNELAFDVTALEPPSPADLDEIEAAARPVLEHVATEPRYAPRRPLLLPQLLQAVNDSDISRRELALIIARDPALAGSLLKLANSAFYRVNERPVESIDRAVALLGSTGIRALVATALMQPVFRLSAAQFPHFPEITWEHTFRSAAAAEAHAAIVEDTDPFAAQLLGLVMGLGAIVVFRIALDQYAARPQRRPQAAVVVALLEAHAAEVAQRIAKSWDLSERIIDALEDQRPGTMPKASSLGRSLQFGRLLGALAVLRAHARTTDQVAKATMLTSGATASQFERLWGRLTAKTELAGARPPR
jgi:HD-like signal output (HDOD) protein